jgi:hypothetical protein
MTLTNAPTNATDALHTRPPEPPRSFVRLSRAHSTRTQTRLRCAALAFACSRKD